MADPGTGGSSDTTPDVTPTQSNRHEFNTRDCPVETVVVYLDRAEVCRSIKTKVIPGENEVILQKMSECVDQDSVRVEGKGSATILEVTFQTKHVSSMDEGTQSQKVKDLNKDITEARNSLDVLYMKKKRLDRQDTLLNGLADQLPKTISGKDKKNENGPAVGLNKDTMDAMAGFFQLYSAQGASLDDASHELKLQVEAAEKKLSALELNLQEMNMQGQGTMERELSVMIESTEGGEIELFVSYVVTSASWTPKYDIRVFGADNVMKIMYYGLIQQSTGEDWDDSKLCLSTAQPSVGGTLPTLDTLWARFQERYHSYGANALKRSRGSFRKKLAPEREVYMMASAVIDNLEEDSESFSQGTLMEIPVAEVREGVTSTMYEIVRRSTIPSDNVGHKVSVAIIDLKPEFEYESVPRRSSHAFLKAKVRNTSPYALLAGPTNVFLDNNFISKSSLSAVSPQEEFTCSLGVDPSIRIDYRPVHKYREQSGLISKTTSTTYKQVIQVKNTRLEPIKIQMSDQLPKTTEEKLKVTLLEPQVKTGDKHDKNRTARLTKKHLIQWDLTLSGNETRELVLRYSVEHPIHEVVKFDEV